MAAGQVDRRTREQGSLGADGRVGVVGAGTMGAGIAQVFATHGYEVTLIDSEAVALERAQGEIAASLARLARKEKLGIADADAARERLQTATTLDALVGAGFVVEAVSENVGVKRTVFATLDRILGPAVVIASNTSSISITKLAAATQRPAQVIGMHFMNPVPVMPLVEVVRGELTSDKVHAATVALAERLDKTPVTVQDSPGFASNRILMPFINEAIFTLMEGVASRDDIDTTFRLGMSHPMGPLQLADLIGLDVCLDILEVLHRELGDSKYRPCPLLRRLVAAGKLGRKSGAGFYSYAPTAS